MTNRTDFKKSVAELLPKLFGISDREVPSGIYLQWGEELRWPEWIFDGTSLAAGNSLPRYVSAEDDLVIMANFLANLGPEKLISSLATSRTPKSSPSAWSMFLSAPNASESVALAMSIMSIQYPFLKISRDDDDETSAITISTQHPGNAIEDFFAVSCVLLFYDIYRCFADKSIGQPRDRDVTISLPEHRQIWRSAMNDLECIVDVRADRNMHLQMPRPMLEAQNAFYDQVAWSNALAHFDQPRGAGKLTSSRDRLVTKIRAALLDDKRVPRIKEIAKHEGVSERTLARRLARMGVSYQALIDDVRSQLAVEMLAEKNLRIDEIASSLGFSHSSSFGRAFFGWHGLSPSKWQKKSSRMAWKNRVN